MKELKYNCVADEQGIIKVDDREKMSNEVRTYFAGKEFELVIREKKKVRSKKLNAYYWAEVVPKIQAGLMDLGTRMNLQETDLWLLQFFKTITETQAHEFVKNKFIPKETVDKDTGEVIKNKLTTSTMTNIQFQDYIFQITQFAAEILHIQIYAPNEQEQLEYEQKQINNEQ